MPVTRLGESPEKENTPAFLIFAGGTGGLAVASLGLTAKCRTSGGSAVADLITKDRFANAGKVMRQRGVFMAEQKIKVDIVVTDDQAAPLFREVTSFNISAPIPAALSQELLYLAENRLVGVDVEIDPNFAQNAHQFGVIIKPGQRLLDIVAAFRALRADNTVLDSPSHDNSPSVCVSASTVAGAGEDVQASTPVASPVSGKAIDDV